MIDVEVGKHIQDLRKNRKITQELIASEMGVSIAAVSKWENNNSLPDIITLCSLADFFDVSLDELVGRSNKKIETIIADPVRFLRVTLTNLLSKNGYTVKKDIEDYKMLIPTLAQNKYVKLLTYELGQDAEAGLKLLREIRQQFPSLNIIVISNVNDQDLMNKTIELGIRAYITKPFNGDMLISLLNDIKEESK